MNFPIFLNKWIISNRYLKYSPFWYWWKVMSHEDYRLDDRFLYQDFWNSINGGQTQMVEDDKWMTYFGAKPEKIYLPAEDYDALVKRLNEPLNPEAIKRFKEIMERRAPWDE
jgi:hypothetical protein